MSGSTLAAAPAAEPVTLEEARSQLRVSDSSEDGLIAGYLLAARTLAEERTGRVFVTQTWVETFDEHWPRHEHHSHGRRRGILGRRRIALPRPPLQSVSSITYVDTTGATQTLDPSQYVVGRYKNIGVIDEAYGVCWPTTRCQVDAISVTYIAGYSDTNPMPETIRQAILLLVGHFYANREAVIGASARISPVELPIGVESLLAKHWVPWVF